MTEKEKRIKDVLDKYTDDICNNCIDQHSNFECTRCPLNNMQFINKVQYLTIQKEIDIYYDE